MSQDMRPYVVRQGDYLVKLAFVHGFDAEEVWNDPKNEEIRGRRADHNILAPGDIIYLPVKEKEALPIVKGTTNKYKAKVPKVSVKLRFLDGAGVLAQQAYTIEGAASPDQGTSDEDGQIELTVPVDTTDFVVVFPERNLRFPVRLGHLDPIEERSGLLARLVHLGYLLPSPSALFGGEIAGEEIDDGDERLSCAVRAFQADHLLETTGIVDDATRDALKAAHDR